jgi:hypothetical protein
MFIKSTKSKNGQAALATILVVGGIISLIALVLAIIVSSSNISAYSFQYRQRALKVASAGIDDALLQLVRNKSFSSSQYTVQVGNDTATVSVSQNSPFNGQATIISQASILSYKSKIRVIVSIDDNGEVRIIKREETE